MKAYVRLAISIIVLGAVCGTPQPASYARNSVIAPFVTDPCPSSRYPIEVMADSPVGYWRLSELTGPTASDRSGNRNHGTYATSGIGFGVRIGCDDTGVSFTGGRVVVPHAGTLNPTWLSIETVVVLDIVPTGLARMVEKSTESGGTRALYALASSSPRPAGTTPWSATRRSSSAIRRTSLPPSMARRCASM
jgi:hypothetical protein